MGNGLTELKNSSRTFLLPAVTASCVLLCLLLAGCGTPRRHISRAPSAIGPTGLTWPLHKKRISRHFGERWRGRGHDGIDIPAPRGTHIYAPASGRVVYAGNKFRGYGRMIIIKHNRGLSTLYGHCHRLHVRTGQRVRRGQVIAQVGSTGRATAPHLHFEVRRNYKPRNPAEYLP